mgnify:CR=1 FL=1
MPLLKSSLFSGAYSRKTGLPAPFLNVPMSERRLFVFFFVFVFLRQSLSQLFQAFMADIVSLERDDVIHTFTEHTRGFVFL